MDFRTKIPLEQIKFNPIEHRSNILLIGSCFAEHIAKKLTYFKFKSQVNPFGILYHPLAIEAMITNIINRKNFAEEDVFQHHELWHSFDAHSTMSDLSQTEIINNLNQAILDTRQELVEATHIIITLGTSWMYRHIELDKIVANCHKVPQKKFIKELLSVDEVSESIQAMVNLIKSVNSSSTIIFTVSPVRHLRDGFSQNNQSKAHLIAAVHQNIEERNQIHYFPAFELMMDELRDYRYYADDMIHPNAIAINYIWSQFSKVWIKPDTQVIMKEIDAIQKGFLHKPFHPESSQHQSFMNDLEERKKRFLKNFPYIVL